MIVIDYIEIGRRISHIRKGSGLTQFEVCELCGFSDKYLSNIERARSIPSIDTLMRICEVIGTTPDKILLGTSKEENNDIKKETASMLDLLNRAQLLLLKDFIKLLSEYDT